ncbi:MAG: anti-sigma factor [Actinomycetota bacterium]
MNEQDFAELAAGHALHALSREDEARYAAALDAHPEWRAIAEDDDETVALLAGHAAPTAPPAHIRGALLAQIATTPQDSAADEPDVPTVSSIATPPTTGMQQVVRGRRWTRSIFALAACLALLVGVGIGAVAINDYLNRPASVVALEQITGAPDAEQSTVELADGGTATAHWSASLGSAVLVTDGISTLSEDQAYELWLVRGETPISAGVFAADDGETTAVLEGELHSGDVIAVTVEQAGGSPNGLPTTDPVVAIPTA